MFILDLFINTDPNNQRDWGEFILNIVATAGTIGAVIVALFYERIKIFFRKAKVEVKLVDPNGDLTRTSTRRLIGPSINPRPESFPAKYETPQTSSINNPNGSIEPIGATCIDAPPESIGGDASTSGSAQPPEITKSNISDSKEVVYYHLRIINKKKRFCVKQCRVSLIEMSRKQKDEENFTNLPLHVRPKYYWAPAEYAPQAIDIFTEEILDFGFIKKGDDTFYPSIWPYFNNFEGFIKPTEIYKYTLEIIADNIKPIKVTFEIKWDDTEPTTFPPTAEKFSIRKVE